MAKLDFSKAQTKEEWDKLIHEANKYVIRQDKITIIISAVACIVSLVCLGVVLWLN